MRYKIDTRYDKQIDTTIYIVYSGPTLTNTKVVTKKGNWLQLSNLTQHEMLLCELREEAKLV